MSVKDVKDYYNKVSEDYHELILTLKDMEEEYKNNLPMFLIGVAIAIISFVLISVCKPYLNMPNGTFYDYLYYGLLGEDVIGNAERIAHAVASGSISMNNVLFYALVIVDALLIVVNLVSGFIRLFEKVIRSII